MHMKTLLKVIKNTRNLDTINKSTTNEVRKATQRVVTSVAPKTGMTGLVSGGAPPSGRGKVREW